MEKYTMVKSEVQDNGDIFLFYMDENGAAEEEGVVTMDQNKFQQLQQNYAIEEVPITQEIPIEHVGQEETIPENVKTEPNQLTNEEIQKLLVFYMDNKLAFQRKLTSNQHLWSVACKTMLVGKTPNVCEQELLKLKRKYAKVRSNYIKHNIDPQSSWDQYFLCNKAFENDSDVQAMLSQYNSVASTNQAQNKAQNEIKFPVAPLPGKKHVRIPDETTVRVLNMYLQHKKSAGGNFTPLKTVFEKIASQVGEDGEFWQKRFTNFKTHYIKLLEKRRQNSSENITWPYMDLFDEIFKDDESFHQKYGSIKPVLSTKPVIQKPVTIEWDETEKTVLVKYCFDCFDEFQDPTIPKSFLWNEVGRLLDKTADICKKKYEELKTEHLSSYLTGGYDIKERKPIAILFDNIISKDTEKKLSLYLHEVENVNVTWDTESFDTLVQFLFDNMELFKDPICHFVCWAAIAHKMGENVETCRDHWKQLATLYKSILEEKKEDPDLQIDWRYIDMFDRICDYGMDTALLDGYEKPVEVVQKRPPVPDKTPKNLEDVLVNLSDSEEFDEKISGKRSRGTEDPKAVKILEYYHKNKDKFATTQRKKHALWEVLAKQLGITAEQCAHRLRNLKQIYTAYIQREINKPDMPVLWPYFTLCKKVFGYRAIKNKLKTGKMEVNDNEEWATKDIKAVITYFYKNFNELNDNANDLSKWADLSKEIGRNEQSCRDKFFELRKSYRKIKTMMSRNPGWKVSWKFFKMFDQVYNHNENMEVDSNDETGYEVPLDLPSNAIKTEISGDDDLQCIIVIPEGEDISSLEHANIIEGAQNIKTETPKAKITITIEPEAKTTKKDPKIKKNKKTTRNIWQKEDKIKLLSLILKHVKDNQGQLINLREMWDEVTTKFENRSPISCKRMYTKVRVQYKRLKLEKKFDVIKKSTVFGLLKQILVLKPQYVREPLAYEEMVLKEVTTYSDVKLPTWKVQKALKYYLDHIEEFYHPKYDAKYAWIDLARNCELSLTKVFKKINYLKQFFDVETNQVNGETVEEFADTLTEIMQKEFICKVTAAKLPEPTTNHDDMDMWSDDETEQLLQWYLNNLDKFKNPKYVPSYLWMEASEVLQKSPLACSKKMTEIRSQYSYMVKESPDALNVWRFYELCQKIYGTGKKTTNESDLS